MLSPTQSTIVAALAIVRAGGAEGLSLAAFAARWPSSLPKGRQRRTLASVAQLLGGLVRAGLVARTALGPHGRFTLTRAGEEMLEGQKSGQYGTDGGRR